MIENKAYALAIVLDASLLQVPDCGGYAVGLTRPDGSYAMFQDTRGAYFSHDSCLSNSSNGVPSEWGDWGSGESWAIGLATLIGGQAHDRGDAWEVLYQRGDGRFAVIGADKAELYQSRGHYAACGKPEYYGWDWDV